VQTRTATSGAKQHVASVDGDKLPDAKGGLYDTLSRDHPSLQDPRAGSGIPGLAGLPTHLEGWLNGRRIGRVSRDDGGFWVEVWLPTAEGSSFEREHLVTEQDIPDSHDDESAPLRGSQAPVVRFETLVPFTAPAGLLDGGVNLDPPRLEESSPEEALLRARILDAPEPEMLWRCRTRQNLTGASLPQIRRGLARAWRLMLALQTREAQEAIDQIELQLDDVSMAVAQRLRAATQLLRAVGLALQDDSLAALATIDSHFGGNPKAQYGYVGSTLRRLGFWRLGKYDSFHALPRHPPRLRWSEARATSAMLDLSIEAAVALDHLQVTTAKRLASDALAIAAATKAPPGLAAIPASLAAQLLYEEGNLDEASAIVRDQLRAINAEGMIECALRAYLLLARVARLRGQYRHAAIVLREAEVLGERRGWPRLVAACARERISLLLDAGRTEEARLSVETLDRYVEAHQTGFGQSQTEIMRYSTLARCRVSWAEAPSRDAAAAFRCLYHRTVDRGSLYAGCRLAVELASMLASIGETEEADSLFFHTIKSGAGAGLNQIFLEKGGEDFSLLLQRAYDRTEVPGSADRGIRQGMRDKQIARVLQISPETVKTHMKHIFLKLTVSTRAEAVSQAKSLGLL
jgi:Bacterial regulatory proteins, luxR family